MSTYTINGVALALMQGDIVKVQVDAIVNAANSGLAGGGGVDGAIHRAGGPSIMDECRKLGGCLTGSAVATAAGRLPARYVFHAVGPIYSGGKDDERLLASAYQSCLDLAEQYTLQSIAFLRSAQAPMDIPWTWRPLSRCAQSCSTSRNQQT